MEVGPGPEVGPTGTDTTPGIWYYMGMVRNLSTLLFFFS